MTANPEKIFDVEAATLELLLNQLVIELDADLLQQAEGKIIHEAKENSSSSAS